MIKYYTSFPFSRRRMAFLGSSALVGGDFLLSGETQGLGIDFTYSTGTGAVTVKDTGTPANNKSNVPVDSFLTNSGTSPKLVRNASGTYVWSPHNQVSRSGDVSTGWTVQQGTTPDAQTYLASVASSSHGLSQAFTAIAGATYSLRVKVRPTGTAVWFRLGLDQTTDIWQMFHLSDGGALGTANIGTPINPSISGPDADGFYTVSVAGVADNTSNTVLVRCHLADNTSSFSGDGILDGFQIKEIQLNRGTSPTTYMATTSAARIGVPMEYDAGWYALVEPAATNLLLRSSEFDNASWVALGTGGVVTANATTAPDGNSTADLYATISTGGAIRQNITGVVSTTYTFSCFAKPNINAPRLSIGSAGGGIGGSDGSVIFNSVTGAFIGVAGAGASATYGSQVLTSGWVRYWITFTTSGADNTFTCAVNFLDASNGLDGVSGYLWNAQLETGSVATSPIPTFGGTVTRAADDITVAVSAFPFNGSEGSVIVDFTPTVQNTASGIWTLDKSTGNNNSRLYSAPGTTRHLRTFDGAAVEVVTLDAGTVVVGNRHKLGAAMKTNDYAAVINGGTPTTSVSGTLQSDQTTLRLGSSAAIGATFHGRYHSFTYLPRRMADVDLQLRTAA